MRLDARFAEAYVELAFVNTSLWWYYFDHGPERAAEARAAADMALKLDPLLADAHRAKGIVLYQLDLDYEHALQEFAIALDRNPSDSQSLAYVGYVKRRQGRTDEAVTSLEKALAVDPLDATLALNLGQTYAFLRRPEEAERRYDDALRQNPVFNRPLAFKLRCRLRLLADVGRAREVERQAEAAGLGADPFVLYHRVLLRAYAGDDGGALDLLARTPVEAFDEGILVRSRGRSCKVRATIGSGGAPKRVSGTPRLGGSPRRGFARTPATPAITAPSGWRWRGLERRRRQSAKGGRPLTRCPSVETRIAARAASRTSRRSTPSWVSGMPRWTCSESSWPCRWTWRRRPWHWTRPGRRFAGTLASSGS